MPNVKNYQLNLLVNFKNNNESACSKAELEGHLSSPRPVRRKKVEGCSFERQGKLPRFHIARRKSGFLFQGSERMLLIRE